MYLAIVVAHEGLRMGFKKQFLDLAGMPMWLRSAQAMLAGVRSASLWLRVRQTWSECVKSGLPAAVTCAFPLCKEDDAP
ncbi:hypothetical protein GCM10025858_15810 [Alicyclobacillus sacchari]|uniref:hypothetical protein n=1 Tax=Alicyclobacillus sacchari TaxID=392010 RepID=UPI0023E9F68F|nr:hypothetical protein [Alicyclobacillus sacchari]GMA57078.1 hypothetical protein GCM10025858_15810 [Alicyclobacillus sacchari]